MQKVEFISFERQKVRFKHFFHQKYMLIPAHRPEAYALTKKYARMETALLQTFVVHYISSMFPMEQLHCRARLSHKYIHVTISRLQTHLPDLPTHTIHAHAHISRMLRLNYMVFLIQIEHNFFEGQRKTVSTKWKMRLVSDGCTSGLLPVRQCSCRAYQQLAPMRLARRMGAGLVIVYGLGLILPLPPTVGYLYPLVSSMSSHTSKRME